MSDDMITPDNWTPPLQEAPHDHKGHSEEKCVRCGWVMGYPPLNCMNNDSPHMFPSQQAEIERLRAELATHIKWETLLIDATDEIKRLQELLDDCDKDFHALKGMFDRLREQNEYLKANVSMLVREAIENE